MALNKEKHIALSLPLQELPCPKAYNPVHELVCCPVFQRLSYNYYAVLYCENVRLNIPVEIYDL